MTNQELFKKIDENLAAIRARRPLTENEVKELDAYYRIGMTYASNALEGNSLTLNETKVLLEESPFGTATKRPAMQTPMISCCPWPGATLRR